jgi:hypothetical protein
MNNTADARDILTVSAETQAEGFAAIFGGQTCQVVWDDEVRATGLGGMAYFGHFLKETGLFDQWVESCPLVYTSNNAPRKRDVLGTIMAGVLNGAWRYAHLSPIQHDRILPEMLGLERLVSEDSVRRALKQVEGCERMAEWDGWMSKMEFATLEPLLTEPYIVDVDTTIKPLYGHQQGAEIGYNPSKPGRPSHAVHTVFIGALRLVLSVDVQGGKSHSAAHLGPNFWKLLDSMPREMWPSLIRGDAAFGNEGWMNECEAREANYLFKLRQTRNVRKVVKLVAHHANDMWQEVPIEGGWQVCESDVQLAKWTKKRRVIVARQKVAAKRLKHPLQPELPLSGVPMPMCWEYSVLITSSTLAPDVLLQLYLDRADCENVFDELKNQWGLAGFTTKDIARCRIMARIVALLCNWWNIFARLADPSEHMEAITSRPMLLHVIAQVVTHANRKVIRLCSHHGSIHEVRNGFARFNTIFNRLPAIAEQLKQIGKYRLLLSLAFCKWLRGRLLNEVLKADPVLAPLLANTS